MASEISDFKSSSSSAISAPSAVASPERVTVPQLRKLHAVAKERGFGHEDLAPLAGVQSLKQLTKNGAAALIRLLGEDRPNPRGYNRHRGRARLEPGEIRREDDATSRQRRTIRYLFGPRRLNWPEAQCVHWLKVRYNVDYAKLDTAHIDRHVASEIIKALDQAVGKPNRRGVRNASVPLCPYASVPLPPRSSHATDGSIPTAVPF